VTTPVNAKLPAPSNGASDNKSAPESPPGRLCASPRRLDVQTSSRLVHSAHAAATGHRRRLLLLLLLHHDALGREHQCGDGRGGLQRGPADLGRVDYTSRDQILKLVGLGVVAEVLVLRLLHLP